LFLLVGGLQERSGAVHIALAPMWVVRISDGLGIEVDVQ